MGGEFNNRIDSGVRSIYINIYTHNMSPSHRNGFNVLNLPLCIGIFIFTDSKKVHTISLHRP